MNLENYIEEIKKELNSLMENELKYNPKGSEENASIKKRYENLISDLECIYASNGLEGLVAFIIDNNLEYELNDVYNEIKELLEKDTTVSNNFPITA